MVQELFPPSALPVQVSEDLMKSLKTLISQNLQSIQKADETRVKGKVIKCLKDAHDKLTEANIKASKKANEVGTLEVQNKSLTCQLKEAHYRQDRSESVSN